MKRTGTALTLLALLALIPCTAQAQPAGTPSTSMTTAPAPGNVADFLATLPGGQSNAPDTGALPPAPDFLSTICTSDADCPAGQKCCYPCGRIGCDFVCMTVKNGRCPLFP
jgi:WAP-type (Whey Acidic protein) with four-disulfide core